MLSYSQELKGIVDLEDFKIFGTVFISDLLIGMLISGCSTYFAVNKFLRMKFDELF
jgi:cell division transport system permease protein